MLQGWIIVFSALAYNTKQDLPRSKEALFNSGQDSKSPELAALIDHTPGRRCGSAGAAPARHVTPEPSDGARDPQGTQEGCDHGQKRERGLRAAKGINVDG